MKWLYQNNYIAAAEVTMPNNKRVDVIGYNREGKWQGYLLYCHEFYFLLGKDIYLYFNRKKHFPFGLLFGKRENFKY